MDGGFDTQSDAEIYFQGSMESDAGLKFTVHVQLEANNEAHSDPSGDDTEIDESYARISGAFGDLELGQRDPVHARMHYATGDAGVGLNAGDTGNWIPGAYLETAGWLGSVAGDNLNVSYITPRVNGVQVGMSYGPDSRNENAPTGAPGNNDDAVWAAAINFNETVGDMSFKVSLGHLSRSQSGMAMFDVDEDNDKDAMNYTGRYEPHRRDEVGRRPDAGSGRRDLHQCRHLGRHGRVHLRRLLRHARRRRLRVQVLRDWRDRRDNRGCRPPWKPPEVKAVA